MDDASALKLLADLMGPEATVPLLLGLSAIGLVVGNWGVVPVDTGVVETHNWLRLTDPLPCNGLRTPKGCLKVFASEQEGVVAFLLEVQQKLPLEVLLRNDTHELAWAVLQAGWMPVEPSRDTWKLLSQALNMAFMRFERVLMTGAVWKLGPFRPPFRLEGAWTHRQAAEALAAELPPTVSSTEKGGMLLWAHVGANYGLIHETQTYNWAMLGQPMQPGSKPPAGHVVDLSGTYAVRVYRSVEEGIQAFLAHMDESQKELASADLGMLAEAMLRRRAFGSDSPFTYPQWKKLVATLEELVPVIEREARVGMAWHASYTPEVFREEANPKPPKTQQDELKDLIKDLPIGKIAVGAGALLIGGKKAYDYYKDRKKAAEGDTSSESEG